MFGVIKMFFCYAHQVCIYLVKDAVKSYISNTNWS